MSCFSVLLSLYEKESPSNFNQAMSSVYCEQTLKPSQIVLVKDGPLPLDLEAEVIRWMDKLGDTLTIVSIPVNVGLAEALNQGLSFCKYELVIRMDTDDVAIHDRFAIQVDFMNNHPMIAVSSGIVEEWNSDVSKKASIRVLPLSHSELTTFAKIRNPISHPACIFRKSIIMSVGGYPDIYPEDHLLWVKIIQAGFELANVDKVLLRMRTGHDFIERRGFKFLKGELASYRIMYKSGFLSLNEFITAAFLRSLVRLPPRQIRKWLYKKFR